MSQSHSNRPFPGSPFPLLPLRSGHLLPGTTLSVPVGRVRSVALLDALSPGALLGVVAQRDPAVSDPDEGSLHRTGTIARIARLERTRDRGYRLVIEGLSRFSLTGLSTREPYWKAEGEPLDEPVSDETEARPSRAEL
ncbi:MAG: LON peptidase substrate-binding domain-containing protein [Polyangiales bacterium]